MGPGSSSREGEEEDHASDALAVLHSKLDVLIHKKKCLRSLS